MKKIIRALLAGYGAKKLGGKTGCGCIGTIVVFFNPVVASFCHWDLSSFSTGRNIQTLW